MRTGLTIRGIGLLGFGIVAVIVAALIGEPDIVWVGLLLTFLPLLALVIVRLTRPRLTVRRQVNPARVRVGDAPRATLAMHNRAKLSLSLLRGQDTIPPRLAISTNFLLARGPGEWEQNVGYGITTTHRGHYRIGPLRVTAFDPMGLAQLTWSPDGEDSPLRVAPHTWPLEPLRGLIGLGSAGEATPHRIGQAGADDVLVREHRYGDDLRRVHWRLSAKQGELMVRLEENPWDPAITLLLDTRQSAHFGAGPRGSFEWCVSMTASIADRLLGDRYRITMLSAQQEIFEPGPGQTHDLQERMLDVLTDIVEDQETSLATGLADSGSLTGSQSVIGILGALTARDAATLTAVGARMTQVAAFVPDVTVWGLPADLQEAHLEACELLLSSGWLLHRYQPDEAVPAAWQGLTTQRAAT